MLDLGVEAMPFFGKKEFFV